MNYEMIIPFLTGISVIMVGGSLLMWQWARRAPVRARLLYAGATGGAAAGNLSSEATPGLQLAHVMEHIGAAASSGKASVSLREQLIQAGFHYTGAAAVYVGSKIALLTFGALLATVLILPTPLTLQNKLLIVGATAILLFFIPNIVVSGRRGRRCGEIRRALPGAIDLLEICASSGMGLDQAWNSVTDEVRAVSSQLADEMALTNLEMHLGASRADAIRHMATRTGAEDLSSLVAVLVQSERFGTSIGESLRVFATSLRETRSQSAQEDAEKMAVKLIFPMIVFIFPAVVMVMAGPAFMSLYRVLAS
jgi:tight adherence protein C